MTRFRKVVSIQSAQAPPDLSLPREEIPQPFSGVNFDVIGVACSAGGLVALSQVLASLPDGFGAAMVVVQHLDPRHRSLMAEILARRTPLRVKEAEEGDRLEPASVYVAPPDRHLLLTCNGTVTLSQAALVHFLRPSGDLMLESLAFCYRDRSIALILTGTGTDGAMGVRAIKKMGGTVIAQDRNTSQFFGMPGAAIGTGDVDFVLRIEEIPAALVTLVTGRKVQ